MIYKSEERVGRGLTRSAIGAEPPALCKSKASSIWEAPNPKPNITNPNIVLIRQSAEVLGIRLSYVASLKRETKKSIKLSLIWREDLRKGLGDHIYSSRSASLGNVYSQYHRCDTV